MRGSLWLVLLMASLTVAISSSQAHDALGTCLLQNNPQLVNLPQPYLSGGQAFWVFYAPTGSGQTLFAAVSDEDGSVVTENRTLQSLAQGVFLQNTFNDVVRKGGWTGDAILPVLSGASSVIGEQSSKLTLFRQQAEAKYPALNLQNLQQTLDALATRVETAQGLFSDASSTQQFYESNPSAEDATSLISTYNTSFDAMFSVLDAQDAYKSAIFKAESDVYRLGIGDPDNRIFNSNLENLREVGISSLYSKAKGSNPELALSRALLVKDRWVGDGVASFSFETVRCSATNAYASVKEKYALVVKNEADLRQNGFGATVQSIKEDWARIEFLRNKKTQDAYQQLVTLLPAEEKTIDQLVADYKTSTQAPTPAAVAPKTGLDLSTVLIFLVLVALVGYGFWQYQQKRKQEEEEGLA